MLDNSNNLATLNISSIKSSKLSKQEPPLVLQSPLSGVSDRCFRQLVRRWAPDALLFTEMVNATSLELGFGRYKVEELADEIGPVAVQLFDHRPTALAEAARRAEASGAVLIDINMGCPVRKIARKGGGSALIRSPDLAAKIVESVANAVKLPVTVKTRLGWCNSSANPLGFALMLQEAGAQRLCLHGRTREQGFKGRADWHAIAAVRQQLRIPVIANGDITSPNDALNCLAITGAAGVMVGRASMGAPWLVGRLQAVLNGAPDPGEPTSFERLTIARDHLQMLLAEKGEHGLMIARKHLSWTCIGFPGAPQLRHALMRAATAEATQSLLEKAQKKL